MKTEDKILMEHVNYSIDGKDILRDAYLKIKEHTFVGIIGPNGSGKTTFLKHLYNAIVPEQRCVYIDGKEIEYYSQNEIARLLTVMKQENNTDFDYTVLDITLMGRSPYLKAYQNYSEEDEKLALEYLRYVGMEGAIYRTFSTLSGGEKQRVLIARSLTQGTDIMILDEPTNHLDIYYQLYMCQIIKRLKKTVVSVFHDLNLAAKFCDYLYVLSCGTIAASGIPKTILTPILIKEVFHINAEIIPLKNGNLNIIFQEAYAEGENYET